MNPHDRKSWWRQREENERQMGAETLCKKYGTQKVKYKEMKENKGKRMSRSLQKRRKQKIKRRGNTTYFTNYCSSKTQKVQNLLGDQVMENSRYKKNEDVRYLRAKQEIYEVREWEI